MNNWTPNTPNPQAIAELLWHRFGLQDGRALALVLDQSGQGDNRCALVQWVRTRLEHYEAKEVLQPVSQLETDLACCLIESGLPGGELDAAVRQDQFARRSATLEAVRELDFRHPRRRAASAPYSEADAGNVIPLPRRSDS